MEIKNLLKSNLLFSIFIKGGSALSALLLTAIVARYYSKEIAGSFFFYQVTIVSVSQILLYGMNSLIVKDLSIHEDANRLESTSTNFVLSVSLVLLAVSLLATVIYSYVEESFITTWFMVGVFLYWINFLLSHLNQGYGFLKTSLFSQNLLVNISSLVLLLINSLLGLGIDVLIIISFSSVPSIAINLIKKRYSLLTLIGNSFPIKGLKTYYKLAISCLFIASSEKILSIVIFYIFRQEEDYAAISSFTIVIRITAIFILLLSAVNFTLAKKISTLIVQEKQSEIQTILKKVFYITGPISVFFIAAISLFGEPILSIFGAEFRFLKTELLIISLAQSINLITGPVNLILLISGNQKSLSLIFLMSLIISISVFLLFNVSFLNAIIAHFIFLSLSSIGGWYICLRKTGLNTVKFYEKNKNTFLY